MRVLLVLSTLLLCGCVSEKAELMDRKILKDKDGNFYQMRAHIGDCVFAREVPEVWK